MKTLFLIRSLERGGAERQLVTLVKELHNRSYHVMVAVFYPNGALEPELRKLDVPVLSLAKRGRWDLIPFLWRLILLVRRERPQIIHGYLATANILTALLKLFFPQVRIVWGVRASNVDTNLYGLTTKIVYWVERWLSHWADTIIFNSHAGYIYATKSGFSQHKTVVIPNGIEINRFKPDTNARQRIRAEWNIHEDEITIGLVARLDPIKDHTTFIQAAALLAHDRTDVRFICVGDGLPQYRSELHSLSDQLGLRGQILWVGERSDMSEIYNAFDIATCSSISEGFPNVIGEAMACGVPCVVTNVGDSAWLVGETGMVTPAQDPQALAAGWRQMLAGKRLSAEAVREHIVVNFSIEALVQKTVDTLCLS